MYQFEKLTAWHEAGKLVDEVYSAIRHLPRNEEHGLIDQLRRAVLSIPLNIAEGSGDRSRKSFVSSINVAVRSQYEVVAGLKLAQRLFKVDIQNALSQADTVGRLLHGLRRSLTTDD